MEKRRQNKHTQRARDVYTTSSQRRCNVMTLRRRCIDVMCPLGSILLFFYTSLWRCIQNLKTLALIEPEKSDFFFVLEIKKNGQLKGMISMRMLFFYTLQLFVPNDCIKFENPRCSSS